MMTGAKNKDLSAHQKKELIQKIECMDESGVKLVYALIKMFSLSNNCKKSSLPYDSKRESESLSFDLEKFPNKLKQILYKFSDLHDKSKNLSTEQEQSI